MISSKPSADRALRSVEIRPTIQRETFDKLASVARALNLGHNHVGRLLDQFVDSIVFAAAFHDPESVARSGYGKLSPAVVRSIRSSREKVVTLALDHGVSEAMIVKIRGRRCYRWVK